MPGLCRSVPDVIQLLGGEQFRDAIFAVLKAEPTMSGYLLVSRRGQAGDDRLLSER